MAIPKVIHYCWFGKGDKPDIFKKCYESWKKFCWDYEIKEWNEDNFDINYNSYTMEAYKSGKWAFISDVARLYVLYKEGGIYVDIDVEFIRPIDELLACKGFMGYECVSEQGIHLIATGLILGAERKQSFIKDLLDDYEGRHFIMSNGEYNTIACTKVNTEAIERRYAFQADGKYREFEDGVVLYPQEYFCPKNYIDEKLTISEKAYSIHHYAATWLSEKQKKEIRLKRIMGTKLYGIRYVIKRYGLWGEIYRLWNKHVK